MSSWTVAGVDLAWMGAKNPTAIAVGKVDSHRVELLSVVENLFGTEAVISALNGIKGLHGVSVDGPLIIKNETGQRECEREVSSRYGSRKASCHTSNLTRYPNASSLRLSSRLRRSGFQHLAPVHSKWQIECYPHPAIIEMFGLEERLAYKKGRVADKREGQIKLGRLIDQLRGSTILPLIIPVKCRRFLDSDWISGLKGASLKHNEDVLDAIVCMYIAALYQTGHSNRVFGTVEDGYIFVPTTKCN